jgi:hypothetical protein
VPTFQQSPGEPLRPEGRGGNPQDPATPSGTGTPPWAPPRQADSAGYPLRRSVTRVEWFRRMPTGGTVFVKPQLSIGPAAAGEAEAG